MKKALILVGILSGTIAAYAGFKYTYPVQISQLADSTGYAVGSLGDARASSSNEERIACGQELYNGTRWGQCVAVTAKGEFGSCWTTDPAILEVLGTLQGDSVLSFGWDMDTKCTRISTAQGSHARPKTP